MNDGVSNYNVFYKAIEKEWFDGYIEYCHICQFNQKSDLKVDVQNTVKHILGNYNKSYYELYAEVKNNSRFKNDLWFKLKNKAAFYFVFSKYGKAPKIIRFLISMVNL